MPVIMTLIFWAIAVFFWQTTGKIFYLINFGYIGTALGTGIAVNELLPKRQRLWGRRLAQFLVGVYMLVFLGLIERENMQMEGFFLYILAGFFSGSVIHYLVAKIGGPLVFGRGWCGWACWTAMILDLLPYRRNRQGRLTGRWEFLRYAHFFISLGLILILWFVFNYRIETQSMNELYWLIGGNLLYYLLGIVLALTLKDNRAFCKYACPIPTLQKLTGRFSLLKIKGDATKCIQCGVCIKSCPMDIKVSDYILQGQRVLSTECILCFECVDACNQQALGASFKFDFGRDEKINRRES